MRHGGSGWGESGEGGGGGAGEGPSACVLDGEDEGVRVEDVAVEVPARLVGRVRVPDLRRSSLWSQQARVWDLFVRGLYYARTYSVSLCYWWRVLSLIHSLIACIFPFSILMVFGARIKCVGETEERLFFVFALFVRWVITKGWNVLRNSFFYSTVFCKNPVFEQYVNDRRVFTMLSNALNSSSFASFLVVKIQSLCSIWMILNNRRVVTMGWHVSRSSSVASSFVVKKSSYGVKCLKQQLFCFIFCCKSPSLNCLFVVLLDRFPSQDPLASWRSKSWRIGWNQKRWLYYLCSSWCSNVCFFSRQRNRC